MPDNDELTTIQVTKSDAAKIKQMYPELRNDALRVSALLGNLKIVKVTALPHADDEQVVPVLNVVEK